MAEKKATIKKEPVAKKPAVKKEVTAEPKEKKTVGGDKYIATIGKRKSASAQVRLTIKGSGRFVVNNMPAEKYFDTAAQRKTIELPLKQVGLKDTDVSVVVFGGGKNGQAEAIRLGVSRALLVFNPELRPSLKAKGWLKRDPRIKERKKPGLKKARRAPQWSKR